MNDSRFTGNGLQMFGYTLFILLVSIFTLGFGAAWATNKQKKWEVENTYYNGEKLVYSGKALKIFYLYLVLFILATMFYVLALTEIGIFFYYLLMGYSLILSFLMLKYVTKSTSIFEQNNDSKFVGSFFAYIGLTIVLGIFMIAGFFTFGFTAALGYKIYLKWQYSNITISSRRLYFDCSAVALWGRFVLTFLILIITLGLGYSWAYVMLKKYIVSNVMIEDSNLQEGLEF